MSDDRARRAVVVVAGAFVLGWPVAGGEITFDDVTEKAGLREPLTGFLGHGAAWGDIDQDGDPDLFVGGFADRPDAEYARRKGPPPNRLFENLGDGTFRLVEDTPVAAHARTSGAVFADLDNDGWPELIVGNNAKEKARNDRGEIQARATTQRTQLFRNVNGKFVDISEESGACPERLRTARNVMPFDYDRDGLLDLFVVEDRFIANPRSALYRNVGDLRFEDITKKAGLPEDVFGLGAAVAMMPAGLERVRALFVAHSNRFFLCRNRRFEEIEKLSEQFAWEPLHNEDWPCGAAFGDLNNDGEPELVVSIHGEPARNRLYLNKLDRRENPDGLAFQDVTREAGLPAEWPTKVPHVEMQDFDNDGWLDLYFSAGWLSADGAVTPLIYRNLGCEPGGVPKFEGPREPPNAKPVYFPAGPSADYDGDGRVDLLLVNWFEGNHTRLLRNTTKGGHWLRVQVRGKGEMNRDGIGALVEVGDGERKEITTGYGYASGQVPIAHFGIGDRETIEEVKVSWRGEEAVRRDVKKNQVLTVELP